MASIMGGFFGGDDSVMGANSGMGDNVIANDMLSSGKALASQYFTASLESATPEVRRLFGEFASQKSQEHGALSELAIKKGWYNAYGDPASQLHDVYEQSQKVTDNTDINQ